MLSKNLKLKRILFYIITIILLFVIEIRVSAQDWIPMGTEISMESSGEVYGRVVALSNDGTIMAVGFPKNDTAGIVTVYQFENGDWALMGDTISGEIIGEDFGLSLDLSADGTTLVVGAPDENGGGGNSGHVRVFKWTGTNWVQKGNTLIGFFSFELFGKDVSINANGSRLLVGAPFRDIGGSNAGAAICYIWNGAGWFQLGNSLHGLENNEHFGQTVAMSEVGNYIVIGSPYSFNESHPGFTRVYELSGADWVQMGADIEGEGGADHSATSLDMADSGLSIAIGAFENSHSGVLNAGHIRVYDWSGLAWEQRGEDINGEANEDNSSVGMSFSADGNSVATGAPNNDGNGEQSGQVKVFHWDGSTWAAVGSAIYGTEEFQQMGRAVALSANGTILAAAAPTTTNQETLVRTYTLSKTSAVYEKETENSLAVFPNPTRGDLQIVFEELQRGVTYTVYNAIGQLVSQDVFTGDSSFDVFIDGPSGLYFLEIKGGDGRLATVKILKN